MAGALLVDAFEKYTFMRKTESVYKFTNEIYYIYIRAAWRRSKPRKLRTGANGV